MKLAVMQPYFFPYIGYWQLMNEVDKFIIYDDVNYIKRGWVNRNRILINGRAAYFTMPLDHPSQNKKICETVVNSTTPWPARLLKMIECSYRRAPYFYEVYPLIEKMIRCDEMNLSSILSFQLQSLAEFMNISVEFKLASRSYENAELTGEQRIIDICKQEGATTYVNLPGGKGLYNKNNFQEHGMDLSFLMPLEVKYKQFGDCYIPWLSILDVMMFNSMGQMNSFLKEYELA